MPNSQPVEVKLPQSAAIIAAVIVIGFFLILIGIAGLLVFDKDHQFGASLAVLCVGFGVIASKFGTVVDFLFGSSWGSRTKDGIKTVLPQENVLPTSIPTAISTITPTPTPTPYVSIDGIGNSTDPSTANLLLDVPYDGTPASIRYNNPGAQYPSARAAAFGQLGYGIIESDHKIAHFPNPVNGAASNFDLLSRDYVGMTIGKAGAKWTGDNGFGIPGYNSNAILTADMINDPSLAIPILKAMARREAGKESPLTDEQWANAHSMFKAGSADIWLSSELQNFHNSDLPSGNDIVSLAFKHIGEKYVFGAQVPKNVKDYKGPWDCAEFASWLVYQITDKIYGCVNDNVDPAKADAYTGSWDRDAHSLGSIISKEAAASTPGAFILRLPNGGTGHIVISDGKGGTIEAASTNTGVVASKVEGRRWDYGVLPPGINYTGEVLNKISILGPSAIYAIGQPNLNVDKVKEIQKTVGIEADGKYGPATAAAVYVYQQAHGLIADGEVGPDTSKSLGIML